MASRGKVCRDWRPLIRSRANASSRKVTNGKQNYRVLPRRNLEAIRAVVANLWTFPSVDPWRRFAGVPSLGKPLYRAGAPNETIVQNHINIALLNVL